MITDDIGQWLVEAGFGTLATNIFKDVLPEKPDEAISITTSGGGPPGWVQNKATADTEMPHFEIMVRSASVATAKSTISEIYLALQVIRNSTINNKFFQRIVPMQTPFPVERDGSDRFIWGCNFLVEKEVG